MAFSNNKTSISITCYNQIIFKILKQLQKDGVVRSFEILPVKNSYRINIFLSHFSKISSLKTMSKVEKRLYSKKRKSAGSGFNYSFYSNSCSQFTKNFGECLITLR